MRELLQALTIDQGFKSFNFCMARAAIFGSELGVAWTEY